MTSSSRYDVVVIGAGLAGASCAYALSRRGLSTLLVESESSFAMKASGNRFALLMPYITTRPSIPASLYFAGYKFTHSLLTKELSHHRLLVTCGAIQLPSTRRLERELACGSPILGTTPITRISEQAGTQIAGITLSSESFFVPDGGFVRPGNLVRAMIEGGQSSTRIISGHRAEAIYPSHGEWTTLLERKEAIQSRYVVVCGAYESSHLEHTAWLPLEAIRGQTVLVRESENSSRLRTLLCFAGYLTPSVDGIHLVGAHYRHNDHRTDVCDRDTDQVLRRCRESLPTIDLTSIASESARVCFRTSTFDRIPYIGAVPDIPGMRRAALQFRPGSSLEKRVPLQLLPGLFISAGHGSKGLLSCPMGGEIVARMIAGEPLDELAEAAKTCDPARFAHRAAAFRHD